MRDPFVVVTDGAYYLYGTGISSGWDDTVYACYKNEGSLDGEWVLCEELVYERPRLARKNLWAPEVHYYKGNYYMLATYYSDVTGHRGCTVLRAPSPEGKFVEISDGQITPKDWDAIDATLYIDREGSPWMIFVHEWTCTEDKIGRMAAARLSEDLSHFISEPVELFRADSPSWTKSGCTDGCFMYETKSGELLMLWSNFVKGDYCVGIARSKNGKPDGEWIHDDELLFSKEISPDGLDGGHGMIFKDRDGRLYLSIHSPNKRSEDQLEQTVFIEIAERDGRLVCLP